VNSEGKLDPPVSLRLTLASINPQTHYIEQVTPDDPDDRDHIPVCKIVNKKEAYDQNKARSAAVKEAKKLQAKTGAAGVKTFEMSWAISGHDLSHRLERMKEFLGEGRRVEVVLAKKKGGRKATVEECEDVLRIIREAVNAVPGAREVAGEAAKPMKLGAMTTLSFAGPAPKTKSARPAQDAQSSVDNMSPGTDSAGASQST
jgi:translation initiation factor IF-3